MSPEEKALLQRAVSLSEENNDILHKMQARQRRATIYGFIKLAIVIAPFVVGYIFLEPYLDQAVGNYESVKELLDSQ